MDPSMDTPTSLSLNQSSSPRSDSLDSTDLQGCSSGWAALQLLPFRQNTGAAQRRQQKTGAAMSRYRQTVQLARGFFGGDGGSSDPAQLSATWIHLADVRLMQATPAPRDRRTAQAKGNAQFEVHYEVAQGLGRLLDKIQMQRVLCHFDPQAETHDPEHVMVQFATPELARKALGILRGAMSAVKPSARAPATSIFNSVTESSKHASKASGGAAFSSIAGLSSWQISSATVAAAGFNGCLVSWGSCDLALDPGPFCSTRPMQQLPSSAAAGVDSLSVKLREMQRWPRQPPKHTPELAPWVVAAKAAAQRPKRKSTFTFSSMPKSVSGC
eukprot:TRINITY_DN26902_c0_g1_i1.p1 TRINITY_DN26902_c0_g1~~TRINITY_DN26902_c0_g1_i1.p1  ORF type:complete len:328 (-),score=68.43 TRINITY_DN26902_c0_g1_i1:114-1097(-)